MSVFHLKIVTADGKFFDGDAERVLVRTIDGDVCILAGHIPYLTALGMGECRVTGSNGETRRAACMPVGVLPVGFPVLVGVGLGDFVLLLDVVAEWSVGVSVGVEPTDVVERGYGDRSHDESDNNPCPQSGGRFAFRIICHLDAF